MWNEHRYVWNTWKTIQEILLNKVLVNMINSLSQYTTSIQKLTSALLDNIPPFFMFLNAYVFAWSSF